MKRFHFVGVVYLIFQLSIAFAKDAKLQVCTHPKPHAVDQNFLKEIGEKGYVIPMHVKLESLAQKKDVPEVDEVPAKNASTGEQSKSKAEKCFELVLRSNVGKVFVPLKCKYYEGMKIRCSGRINTPVIPGNVPLPVPSPAATFPRPDGTFFHSKTDNATYSVIVGCLASAQPMWLVLAGEPELKKSKKEEILNHIHSLGFSRDDVSSISDPVIFQRLDKGDCDKDPTNVASNPFGAFLAGVEMVQKQANNTGSPDEGKNPNSEFIA